MEPHQGENGLSLVIDRAEFLPGFQTWEGQDMAEGAGLFILHKADAGGEPFHQLVMAFVIEDAGIFGERQDGDGIASQLYLVVGFDKESRNPAVGQKCMDDQVARHAGNRLADRLAQERRAGQFVRLDHCISRAGMAKRVVGADLPVETGVITVNETAVGADLAGEEFGGVIDQ
ncbi:hypothetical protein D3C80_161880 [compost metagenome]